MSNDVSRIDFHWVKVKWRSGQVTDLWWPRPTYLNFITFYVFFFVFADSEYVPHLLIWRLLLEVRSGHWLLCHWLMTSTDLLDLIPKPPIYHRQVSVSLQWVTHVPNSSHLHSNHNLRLVNHLPIDSWIPEFTWGSGHWPDLRGQLMTYDLKSEYHSLRLVRSITLLFSAQLARAQLGAKRLVNQSSPPPYTIDSVKNRTRTRVKWRTLRDVGNYLCFNLMTLGQNLEARMRSNEVKIVRWGSRSSYYRIFLNVS